MSDFLNLPSVLGGNRRTTPDGPEAQNLVQSEIYRHFRYPKRVGNNIEVPCCFHVVGERFTRTLSICLIPHVDNKGRDIKVGQYRCWSCGAKGMWNKLADEQHLTRLEETDNPELVPQMMEPGAYEHTYEHPGEDELYDLERGWYWEKKGTKILYNTLMRVGAKWYRCPLHRNGVVVKTVKRLWLPAHFHNEVVGHIAAYTGTKPNKVPYSNSSGQWASHYFFGFDEAYRLSTRWKKNGYKRFCFVVEGPRDGLVMLQNQIPAVVTMGTNSWTQAKANILALEFDHIFACGDGDMAGKKMNTAIKTMLEGSVPVTVVKLEPETDPAGLGEADYKQIADIIKRHAV